MASPLPVTGEKVLYCTVHACMYLYIFHFIVLLYVFFFILFSSSGQLPATNVKITWYITLTKNTLVHFSHSTTAKHGKYKYTTGSSSRDRSYHVSHHITSYTSNHVISLENRFFTSRSTTLVSLAAVCVTRGKVTWPVSQHSSDHMSFLMATWKYSYYEY